MNGHLGAMVLETLVAVSVTTAVIALYCIARLLKG